MMSTLLKFLHLQLKPEVKLATLDLLAVLDTNALSPSLEVVHFDLLDINMFDIQGRVKKAYGLN